MISNSTLHEAVARLRQTQRLYDAEQEIAFGELLTIGEIRQLVHVITHSSWWEDRTALRQVRVSASRDEEAPALAWIEDGVGHISFGPNSRCELVLMHELSHLVTGRIRDGHNAAFAGIFLETVRRWMGEEHRFELEAAFQKHGVIYSRAIDSRRTVVQNWSAI